MPEARRKPKPTAKVTVIRFDTTALPLRGTVPVHSQMICVRIELAVDLSEAISMRHSWTRWAIFALAISVCVPVAFARGHKSIARCTSFDQADKGEDAVQFTITNSCTMPVDCHISWKVVCAPKNKRRAVHASSKKFALENSTSETAEASAAVCGDDAWSIESIQWSCEPNND